MPNIDPSRLAAANRVLATFRPPAERVTLEAIGNKLYLIGPAWRCRARIRHEGLWLHDPIMHRRLAGTEEQASVQLIRWLRDLPRRSRLYWCSLAGPGIRLGDGAALGHLERGGYFEPAKTSCVLCGRFPDGLVDWWCRDGVSGSVCSYGEGCRDRGKAVAGA